MKRLVTAALLAGLLANPALAEELTGKLKSIAATKTLLIGHQTQSIPFSFVDTNGQVMGYSIDLCKRVAAGIQQQLNLPKLEVKYVPLTPENRFEMVASGQVDIECGNSSDTISRQKMVDFSLMTWVDGANFLVKGEKAVSSLADMSGKKIGVVAGNTTEKALQAWMQKNMVTFEMVPVKSHLDGMRQLNEGLIDAYAADQTVLIGLAASVSKDMRVSISPVTFSYEPYALVVPRNDADFKQAVNRVLAQLYRTGEVLKIYNAWFGKFGKPPLPLMVMYELNALPE
ncbi:amino acid ABC transporter substrate-binding protein [Pseudomonas sp. N040]|uniref:amino acid ABC transporter substrate-binding protein n=1 Tax=Pseudomonas sp. N040 TaxID=2785325 RepID=UPI0018A2FE36|nr:amino acid ABC transporter substrate-binding protein [Pseudomonas sp. N040]MBF7729373.1 amino acid ABC transporter substrate-binding protein [Pseudomonas sp. N040]MBW7013013.1 amino acid ABC transporter substrate-binding protein [Pseudomonas sp. N040]